MVDIDLRFTLIAAREPGRAVEVRLEGFLVGTAAFGFREAADHAVLDRREGGRSRRRRLAAAGQRRCGGGAHEGEADGGGPLHAGPPALIGAAHGVMLVEFNMPKTSAIPPSQTPAAISPLTIRSDTLGIIARPRK